MTTEHEQFCKRVREQCNRIIVAGYNGNGQRAAELAGELCAEAHRALMQDRMTEEQASIESLDLAAMPAPSFANEEAE